MNRKIVMLTLCVLFLSSGASVFAQKEDKSVQMMQDVYVTKSGKKYHKADCSFIQDRKPEKISKKEALAKGLSPCPKCFKEDLPPENKKK